MNVYRLKHYLNLRTLRLLLFYALICGFSYFVAFQLRFDFDVPEKFMSDMVISIGWVIGLKLILLLAFGQVDCVLTYFRLYDAVQLFISLLTGSVFLVILWYSYEGIRMPPRAVILTDLLISFLLLAGFRVGVRIQASSRLSDWFRSDAMKNVIIVGAGEVGSDVCSELKNKTRFGMCPVAFLDDDPDKVEARPNNVPGPQPSHCPSISSAAERISSLDG